MAEESRKNRPEWDGKHDLYIGVKNDLSPFTVDLKALTRGLVVVGQSGCGKSFMLGRLVEEIVRKTMVTPTKVPTRLLIIDPNSDFSEGFRLKEMPKLTKTLNKYKSGLLEENFNDFVRVEDHLREELKDFQEFIVLKKLGFTKLSWKYIIENHLVTHLLKANKYDIKYLFALGLLNNVKENNNLDHWIKKANALVAILLDLDDISDTEDHVKERIKKYIDVKHEIFELLGNLSREGEKNIWDLHDSENTLPGKLFDENLVSFLCIEEFQRRTQITIIWFLLLSLFAEHQNRTIYFRNTGDKSKLLRTFILIDEAHNFAPEDTNDPHEKMLGELIHTIAAEGRKYGLHLILATQRPNKVKRGLLGELDNAIIMKMNSRRDLNDLAEEMRILDVKLLEPCLSFQGQGNAIAVGEMTRMAPYTQIFKSAPRRTKEGGVDIPFF